MASDPGAPDWYSHGLNRVVYYRLATLAAVKPGEELTSLATMVVTLERVIRAHDAWSPPHGRS